MDEPRRLDELEVPPRLDAEDEMILRRIWDEIAAEDVAAGKFVPGLSPTPVEAPRMPDPYIPPERGY